MQLKKDNFEYQEEPKLGILCCKSKYIEIYKAYNKIRQPQITALPKLAAGGGIIAFL